MDFDFLEDDIFDSKPRRRKKKDDDFLDDILNEPTPGELRQQQAEERRSVTPEEESSILGQASDMALSGLGWVGEVFDKYSGDRAIRGLLAGKPRELLSILPGSDMWGATSREDLTTGEDLNKQWFGLEKDNSWTSLGAGMATEVGLGLVNPLSWIGTAAEALTPAGKIAKATGLADNTVRVANRKLAQEAGQAGAVARKMGGFESQMTTTLRDLIEDGGEEALELARQTAAKTGDNLDDLLDMPLGHRLGVKDWAGNVVGELPGFGAKDALGLTAARWSDAAADTLFGELPSWVPFVGGKAPLVGLRSLFDPQVDDAITKRGQEAIAPRTTEAWKSESDAMRDALEMTQIANDAGIEPDVLRQIQTGAGDYFDPALRPKDGEKLLPSQLHRSLFDAEKERRLGGRLGEEFGFTEALQEATKPFQPHNKTVVDAIKAFKNSGRTLADYDKLRQAIPSLGPLDELQISQINARILNDLGEYASDHSDIVEQAMRKGLPVTQEAFASAVEKRPELYGLRKFGEGPAYDTLKAEHPAVYEAAKREHGKRAKWIKRMAEEGFNVKPLIDSDEMFYAPRYLMDAKGVADDAARSLDIKHFPGGTTALTSMLMDAAQAGDTTKVSQVLDAKYGDKIEQQLRNEAAMKGTSISENEMPALKAERIKSIAESITSATPEQKAAGFFGNEVQLDTLTYDKMMSGRLAVRQSANDAMADVLQPLIVKDKATGQIRLRQGASAGEGVPLSEIAKKLGFDPGLSSQEHNWTKAILKRLGIEAPQSMNHFDGAKKLLLDMKVPEDLAKDLLRLHGKTELPDNIQNAVGLFDSMTQLFKSFVLTWPARYTRDLMSGQVQSMILGNWSGERAQDVMGLLTGAESDKWKSMPAVQEILKHQGINPASADAKQATQALRILLGSVDRLGQGQTSEVARQGGATAQAMLESLPGAKPASFTGLAEDASKHYSGVGNLWNDMWTIEGAFGATETKNPIVRAGNYAGAFTDKLNRYVPFLSLLDQGYSPAAAVERVMMQQVDYCVDEETEILTENGWKHWHQISEGEMALTLDPETNAIEWSPIQAVNTFAFSGELNLWKSKSFIAATTDAHRWLAYQGNPAKAATFNFGTRRNQKFREALALTPASQCAPPSYDLSRKKIGKWTIASFAGRDRGRRAHWFCQCECGTQKAIDGDSLKNSRTLSCGCERAKMWRWITTLHANEHQSQIILSGGYYAGPSKETYSDEFVELVGWYVTEGWDSNKSGIAIAQSEKHNPHFVDRLRWLAAHFSSTGATAHERKGYDHGCGMICNFYFGLGIGDLIRKACPNKSPPPEFLRVLTSRQVRLLYETMMDGDGDKGSRRPNKWNGREQGAFAQKDPGRVDAFQMICAMLGLRTASRDAHSSPDCKIIRVLSSTFLHTSKMTKDRMAYSGVVWCPTTPTGTWLARRSGSTWWTGNSGKALGRVEQTYLARLFPFYKFSRGMAKQLATELWEKPRGSMANVIKSQAILARQDDDEFIPSHIRQTMAIPFGGDGKNKSFITGFGLAHEDVFGLIRPGAGAYDSVQGLLQELGGRAHPWIKAPVEVASGTQLYSGRDLRDLEGGLGRALGNVAGTDKAVEIPILAEEALSMSPFSRAVSTVRTAFDPRKDLVQKMLNLGTGMRTETVDMDRARQVEIRKAIDAMLRGKPGINAMETLYADPEAVLAPEDDAAMRYLRRHNYEQQKARRPKKEEDALSELLGL